MSVTREDIVRIGEIVMRIGDDRPSRLGRRVSQGLREVARSLDTANILLAHPAQYHRSLSICTSAALAALPAAPTNEQRERLTTWYWRGLFREQALSKRSDSLDTAAAQLLAWLNGGPEPVTPQPQPLTEERLLRTTKPGSPLFAALKAVILAAGPLDWMTGEPITRHVQRHRSTAKLDAHHVFPRSYCTKAGIDESMWDSIVNKTMIGSSTNRSIGSSAPSAYLQRIVTRSGISRSTLDERVSSHLIDPSFLWRDDFHGFLTQRASDLQAEVARLTT